jgi:indole-3-glycerol phosphate synthase
MPSILQEIVANTQQEILQAQAEISQTKLEAKIQTDGYQPKKSIQRNHPQIIAEIKPKSPSSGRLLDAQKPIVLAQTYETHGASALSVLTDEKYFGGNLKLLQSIRQASNLPILRKEFILEPYQVYETRAAKADLLLLIYQIIPEKFSKLLKLSLDLGLQPLVEIHGLDELTALWPVVTELQAEDKIILGINNRNLNTFEVNWRHSLRLADKLPQNVLKASLSGIDKPEQARELYQAGFDFVLIGQGAIQNPDLIRNIVSG